MKYQFRGTRGLVLYMARCEYIYCCDYHHISYVCCYILIYFLCTFTVTTDTAKLKSQTNEHYLLSSADVIGSIVSLRDYRRILVAERRAERESLRRRVRHKMIAFIALGGSFLRESCGVREHDKTTNSDREVVPEQFEKSTHSISTSTRQKSISIWKFIKTTITKWRGAGNEPPPPFTNTESIWTFVGCFLTLLMLLTFSDAITKRNPEYSLVTGPFGVSCSW